MLYQLKHLDNQDHSVSKATSMIHFHSYINNASLKKIVSVLFSYLHVHKHVTSSRNVNLRQQPSPMAQIQHPNLWTVSVLQDDASAIKI